MHSRVIPDGRPSPVGLVRHACTSSFRTNPTARMERKAARSRRRDQRRSEYPGRSAIHICNMTRCDSVSFHSLVPVFDTSDPLKRSQGRLRLRSHSRHALICKERTKLHAARPGGPMQSRRRGSRTGEERERFETETPAGSTTGGLACRLAAPAPGRHRDVVSSRAAPPPVVLQSPDSGGARTIGRARLALRPSRGSRRLTGKPHSTHA